MGDRHARAAYRDLGRMLRKVRKAAGMSETALARRLEWHLIMISRMETGFRPSTTTDVVQYLVGCGIRGQAEMRPFVEFTRQAELKMGYHLSDYRIGGSLQSLIFHESSAERLIIYAPQVINGLLQIPDYARTLFTAAEPGITEDEVVGAVRTRMNRQRILSQSHHARFIFYLQEQALRLRVGSDEIMHEQLLHIVLLTAMDNVTVRIVPNAAGARSAFGGPFRLMEFPEHRPIVYLDNLRSGLILEDPGYVKSYYDLVPMLADVALDEGQSRELAADLADAYDRGSQQGAAAVLAKEQLQRECGLRLCGSGVVESPTPIYEA